MKTLKRCVSILTLIFIVGCATANINQIKPLPSFYSDKFPSYEITSEITDGVKIKFAEGNGETKWSINTTLSRGKNNSYIPGRFEYIWDVKLKSDKILYDRSGFLSFVFKSEEMSIQGKYNIVSDMQGNVIGGHIDNLKSNNISFDEKLEKFEQNIEQTQFVYSILPNVGKTLKTRDELRKLSLQDLSELDPEMKEFALNLSIWEIVDGWSTYKGRKVIVTKILGTYGDRTNKNEVKAKGYNLYDAKTFFMLAGEGSLYSNFIDARDMESIQMDWSYETKVNHIYAVHNSLEHTSTVLTNEKNIPDWDEATKKIEALGDLLNKGLITQEEFDRIKAKLLEEF